MIYKSTSRRREGFPDTLTRAELLGSPHAEVRQAAARMRPVVFNGVRYLPTADARIPPAAPLGRSRVTSLPSHPAPRPEGRTPPPSHVESLDLRAVVSRPVVDASPRLRPAGHTGLLALAAALWIAAGAGFAWLALRDSGGTDLRIAAPYFDRRAGQ